MGVIVIRTRFDEGKESAEVATSNWIWQVKKKWLLFLLPFHSYAPCIFISYCCVCHCQAVCYYYMPVPTKYHWNISFQNFFSSKYVVKNARNVTQFVWQTFSIEFQGFVKKKRIEYIHQNLRYYETIEQIHFMVVKKIESYAWEKIVISDPLLYRRPPSPKTTKE
jgi:hypothetical protein